MDALTQIKCAVLAATAPHKEKLIEQCVQHALDGTHLRDRRLAQSALALFGIDAARALIAEWIRRAESEDGSTGACWSLLRCQLLVLSVEEFLELAKEYLTPCKLSNDSYIARIQIVLIRNARVKHKEVSALQGLISKTSSLLQQAAASSDPLVRKLVADEAHLALSENQRRAILRMLAEDPDERVRSEAQHWLSNQE